MYAVYAYYSGASQANVLADLVAILAGETNKTNLSAGCDKANTTITATVASGWTVHDASAGTQQQVIKAPYVDNGSQYKYLMLDHSSAGYLNLKAYETWDAGAHSGTNATNNTIWDYYQPKNTSATGKFYLWASPRFVAMAAHTGAEFGDVTYRSATIFAEFSRWHPSSTASNNMPSAALIFPGYQFANQSSKGAFLLRAQKLDGTDATGSAAVTRLAFMGGNAPNDTYFPTGPDQRLRNDDLSASYVPFMQIALMDEAVFGAPMGDISTISDIWVAPTSLLGNLENVTKDGNNYIAVQQNSTASIMFLLRAE